MSMIKKGMQRRTTIDRAILLAAGLGTRLKPLTLKAPKPMLPLDGEPLIDHQIYYLKSHGIVDIVINLHHLGYLIRKHVGDGSCFGVSIRYSEEPSILGTGGGIRKAASLFGEGPFIVLNSDALIDADLTRLMTDHVVSDAAATMVVKKLLGDDDFTPIDVTADGFISSFGRGEYIYTGLQIVGERMLNILPPSGTKSCLIEDGYKRMLKKGERIRSFIYDGYWNDLGTMDRYEQAKRDIEDGKFRPIRR